MAHEIFINGFIGDGGFFGGDFTTLTNVRSQVANKAEGENTLDVVINSGGGYVTEGFAIYDYLCELGRSGVTVNTKVTGLCGSIATIIAQAGKFGMRSGYENSDYFIHPPAWSPQSPDPIEADELQKIADDLLANQNKLSKFYAENGTGTEEFFLDKMKEAKSLSMSEAKSLGLIDKIISSQIQAATLYKFAAHVTKTETYMNKVETFIANKFKEFKAEIQSIVKPASTNEMKETSEGVKVYYDGSLEVGTKVFADEAMTVPAPDGVHTVDTTKYTIVGGVVTESEEVVADKTEVEVANEKIAELTAQLAAKEGEVTAAVAAKEVELTAKFEEKFTAFKGTFFTGEKLNPAFEQIIKSDNAPAPAKSWKDEVIAIRNKK